MNISLPIIKKTGLRKRETEEKTAHLQTAQTTKIPKFAKELFSSWLLINQTDKSI